MNIDQIDLAIIRALENGGKFNLDFVANSLNLDLSEITVRINQFETSGLIKTYNSSIRLPALLGGDWTLGCAFCVTKNRGSAINQICINIPFVTEIFHNICLPDDLGPNLSFLFYTKDFPSSFKFINDLSECKYVEIYNLRQYHFPIPAMISIDEKKLLLELYKNPLISQENLSLVIGKDLVWIQEKISRLVANPGNIDSDSSEDVGIIQVVPELDWLQCDNYSHIHFLVELGSNNICPALPDFPPVLSGKPFRNKFCQLESDLWGVGELIAKVNRLQDSGIAVKGLIFADSNQVINHWVPKLIE